MPAQTRLVGTLSITMRDGEFITGYEAGYERYLLLYRHAAISDNGVYAFLAKELSDLTHQDRYHAGFITGWYAALYGQTEHMATMPVLEEEA